MLPDSVDPSAAAGAATEPFETRHLTKDGRAIEVEVWQIPTVSLGSFVEGIPPPLAIGSVELEDGSRVKGFLCEAHATDGARDITEFGGWRRYLAGRQSA